MKYSVLIRKATGGRNYRLLESIVEAPSHMEAAIKARSACDEVSVVLWSQARPDLAEAGNGK